VWLAAVRLGVVRLVVVGLAAMWWAIAVLAVVRWAEAARFSYRLRPILRAHAAKIYHHIRKRLQFVAIQ